MGVCDPSAYESLKISVQVSMFSISSGSSCVLSGGVASSCSSLSAYDCPAARNKLFTSHGCLFRESMLLNSTCAASLGVK